MAADIVSIGLAVDSRDVKKASEELKNLGSQGDKAAKATDGLKNSFGKLSRQSAAYSELQIRSDREIRRETQKVIASFNRLKESGQLSGRELERASQAAKRRIKELTGELKGTTKASDGLASSFKGYAVLAGITAGVWSAINAHREFTKSISELSAITGATGRELEFYKNTARDLGATTTFSASEVATSFKLVASAKPELLESKEALAAVTREVLTLSEASGLQLPEAANALGGALNQFGAGAEEASRFINVLAAGSKFGASEIADTSEAMKNAGAVAASLGLSFESTNAAIQAMASVSIKGAEAGTGLRGVLLKLAQQSNQEFNPEIVGLEQALKNLSDANLTTSEKVKLFGQESITAATALINQADSIGELTTKLTGTTVAYDQARTNTNNLDGDIKALGSAWEAAALTLGETFNPALRAIVKSLAWVSKIVQSLVIAFGDMGDAMGAYAAIAVEIATLNFEEAVAIKEARDQQAALNEKRLADIWAEKDATEQLSDTVKRTAEEEAAIELKKQQQRALLLENKKKLDEEARIAREKEEAQIAREEEKRLKREEQLRLEREKEVEKQWEKDAAMFDEEIKRDQEFYDRKLAVEKGYLDSAFGARSQMAQDAFDFSEAIRTQDYQNALSSGTALFNAISSSGKKTFEFGKKLSIANAIISGGQAAVDAWKAGMKTGGPFAPTIAASYVALSLARTTGLINSIKSQSFGGGGSISGGGGGAPSAPSATQGGTALPQEAEVAQAQPTKELRVVVESDGPHSDGMRKFAENLAETVRDMGSNINLVVS